MKINSANGERITVKYIFLSEPILKREREIMNVSVSIELGTCSSASYIITSNNLQQNLTSTISKISKYNGQNL